MRVIVFGAGSIGGVIGGRLFEHGHDVLLIARGAHYEEVLRRGLLVTDSERCVRLPIPVVAGPDEIEFHANDVLLLTVKSQSTNEAIHALAAVAPVSLPVICAQNGVENERIALRAFEQVYGMCVICPATHEAPGVVRCNSYPTSGILDLGLWPNGVDAVARGMAAALSAASFSSTTHEDIPRWKWGKLLANLVNAVEVVCGIEARSGKVAELARSEALACLSAAGIAHVSPEEERIRRGALLSPFLGGSSSWQSLVRKSGTIEVDFLNGEIVLLGRLCNVPTPVNEVLQHVANRLARDRHSPGVMSEAELLAYADTWQDRTR
jgi:2-dehydropantoate 2-reductase